VEERAAGVGVPVHELRGERHDPLRVVRLRFAAQLYEAGPAAADADDVKAFMQGALSDAADGRVEPRHVAPPGEDADAPLLALVHDCLLHTQVSPSTRMKVGSPCTSGSVFILSRAAKN
jgi:hypothetical protein